MSHHLPAIDGIGPFVRLTEREGRAMTRLQRAERIRDELLREAGMTLASSLAICDRPRIISSKAWHARLGRIERTGSARATKLEIWVGAESVAVMGWTNTEFWVARMKRGAWESAHFNLPPYRTPAERWLDICNSLPIDASVVALMSNCEPRSVHGELVQFAE
jgi:hypothetical protein